MKRSPPADRHAWEDAFIAGLRAYGMASRAAQAARCLGAARALRGLLPTRLWDAVAGPVFRVYASMDHFTGRAHVD